MAWPHRRDGSNSKRTGSHPECNCESLLWEEDALRMQERKALQQRAVLARRLLTRRQLDILGLLARGYTVKKAAAILFLSENTARLHLARARQRLYAPTTTLAIVKAFRLGLLELPELTEIQAMYGARPEEEWLRR